MKVEDMSELKQIAIKHNHSLFRLAGLCKTARELISDCQEHMTTPVLNMLLEELQHIDKQLRRSIEVKFQLERGKATAPNRVAKTK